MNILHKLVVSLVLAAAFALLFGAAALLGRNIGGPLAAIEFAGAPEDIVEFGLVDIDRGLMARKTIAVPQFAGARFESAPALVLQADRHDGRVDWTLSELDPLASALTTRVEVTTPRATRLTMLNFQQADDQSWRIFTFESNETYYAPPGRTEALLVSAPNPNFPSQGLAWSPDGTRVAMLDSAAITIDDADGQNERVIPVGNAAVGALRWSPDGRYIATSWGGQFSTVPSAVVDTQSGAVVARMEALRTSWCGGRVLYITSTEEGMYEGRLLDLLTGLEETVLQRDLSAYALTLRTFFPPAIEPSACEWFLFTAIGEGYSAYHLPTGTSIPLGINVQFEALSVTATAMTVRVNVNSTTELRRVMLNPPATDYDVLATVRGLSTTLLWLGDGRGSLNLRADQLFRLDSSGAEAALTPPGVLAFFVIE